MLCQPLACVVSDLVHLSASWPFFPNHAPGARAGKYTEGHVQRGARDGVGLINGQQQADGNVSLSRFVCVCSCVLV